MQNFIKTIFSGLKSWTKKEIKNSAADWNQNDSSADNYIKNKPYIPIVDSELSENSVNAISNSAVVNGFADIENNIKNTTIDINNAKLPAFYSLQSVCYGDGKYVATNYNSKNAVYSADGVNWIQSTLPENAYWKTVCYGNGKFVAIASGTSYRPYDSEVAYSTDGINWARSTLPIKTGWESVCYGDGKYVAVGYNGSTSKAYYVVSTDGINWTGGELPSYAYWKSVCYGNGKFVAVGSSSNKFAYSTDGINWIQSALPEKDYWCSVCYGDGKFVAVANGSSRAVYSTDGINWIQSALPEKDYWNTVCYGNGKYIVIIRENYGKISNMAAYSTDGINWTKTVLPFSADWQSICYGDGKFVAVASESDMSTYSFDGIRWYNKNLIQSDEDITEDVYDALAPYISNDHIQKSGGTMTGSLILANDPVEDLEAATKRYADSKMNTTNPVGSGSFSMNRKAGIAVGNYSHAEGLRAEASGDYSHGEGLDASARGNYSHAEGYSTIASGSASHAEGWFAYATGNYSHAEGSSTIASGECQHAQGKSNIEDTAGKYAHIVGNGRGPKSRSNAHTLDWDGNAWYAGDVYVGSTSGTNKDDGSKKLATEEWVEEKLVDVKPNFDWSDITNKPFTTKESVHQCTIPANAGENEAYLAKCAYDSNGNHMPFLTHVIPPIGTEAITVAAGNSSLVAFLFEMHDAYSIYSTNDDPDGDIPIILTVVYKAGTSFDLGSGSGVYTAPSAGIYLWPNALGNDNDEFVFSISWEREHIDPKVLPEGGFGYVDNVNIILPVTTLNLQKDTEASIEVMDVIYGDYPIVDGHEYFINFDGTAYPVTVTKGNEGDYTLRSDECPITAWVIHSQGVDAIAFSADQSYIGTHTVSITTGTETIHKIDPKFLPEGGVGYTQEEIIDISYDGSRTSEAVDINGFSFVKVSDEVYDISDITGAVLCVDNTSYTIIERNNTAFRLDTTSIQGVQIWFWGFTPVIGAVSQEAYATVGVAPGIYVLDSIIEENEVANEYYVASIYGAKKAIVHKIDTKFIPAEYVTESELAAKKYLTSYTETDPTVPAWAKESTKPTYTKDEIGLSNVDNVKQYSASNPPPYPVTSVNGKTGAVTLDATAVGARPSTWMPSASDVGADSKGTASLAVSAHNTATDAHSDIRLALKDINDRLNAFFDSDDKTLDELSEIVTYITSNKALIDSITTSKVSVSDIVNNLTTNVSNKPLSAAQGVALKGLIDTLNNGKLDASALSEAINTALAQAKESGEFDGKDGATGETGATGVGIKSITI